MKVFDRRRRFDTDTDAAPDLADVMNAGKRGGYSGVVRIKSIKPVGGDRYKLTFETGPALHLNLRMLLDMQSVREQCQRIHENKRDLYLPASVVNDETWREYLCTLLERPEVDHG